MKKFNCVEEITLSNDEIKALELMEDFLSGGAGALITCKCETKLEEEDDKNKQG